MTDSNFAERLIAMRETLFRMCYAQLPQGCDREDAVQETLLKAWGHRKSLRDERFLQTWVIRILINECRNIQRSREIPHESVPERAAPDTANAELHDALFRLEEKLRLPVILHYIEGFSAGEAAAILKIPRGTLLWRLSKARGKLREALDPVKEVQNHV
jgi:RNA polymerase sigma-70 factor (ECF subfamily)